MTEQSSKQVLAAEGPLAETLSGFSPRLEQQAMAEAVETALLENDTLVVEAGTGTGKTFAYLVPAILSGKKVIVSTGTKNLQDQLFHRDLPLLKKSMRVTFKSALLKGRANYLCLHRLQVYFRDGRFPNKQTINDLQQAKRWSIATVSGDVAELASVKEDSQVWPYITSTAENCLGQDCSFYNDCFLVKARREAQKADVLVINHHLFFADASLRDVGFGEILPGSNAVIFDEAHQLAETATHFLGDAISSRQLNLLAQDAERAMFETAQDTSLLLTASRALLEAVKKMRLALGHGDQRQHWQVIRFKKAVVEAVALVGEGLKKLTDLLEASSARSKDLENCWQRAEIALNDWQLLTGEPLSEKIYWFETRGQYFKVNATPIVVADFFKDLIEEHTRSFVFTSATLTVNNEFSHLQDQLGLYDAKTLLLGSPFDYQQQALMYLPPNMPEPNAPNYTEAVVNAALPVLKASGGRAFLLFTSYRALNKAQALLENSGFELFIQGSMPKQLLLDKFRDAENAVLLGTQSFWEGVDVRGDALSCVIIDKLPFASPSDPVLKARVDHLKRQGRNAFAEYQLPNAAISLKQGVGRLIRDTQDRGVLMLCDPRLRAKSYGRVFLASLPKMRVTNQLTLVEQFFVHSVA